MRNDKSGAISRLSICLFLIIELVVYLIFFINDLAGGNDMIYLKYASVCLCFLFSLKMRRGNALDCVMVSAGLALTLAADVFLLLLSEGYETGISLFILVHFIYFARLIVICFDRSKVDERFKKRGLVVFVVLNCARLVIMLAIPFAVKRLLPDYYLAENVLAAECFCNLTFNAASCFCFTRVLKKARLFAAGLILLALCDLCVGAFNVFSSGFIYDFASAFMWAFYLPSQVAIALSSTVDFGDATA